MTTLIARRLAADKRCLGAYRMRCQKKTDREIADAFGVSPQRAQQLAARGERLSGMKAWWAPDLPSHLGLTLEHLGYKSKDDVAEGLRDGKLRFTPEQKQKTSVRYIRPADLQAICAWLEIEPCTVGDTPPISRDAFATAIAKGKSFRDAIDQHIAGKGASQRKLVVRTLQAVADLDAKCLGDILCWAKGQPAD